MGKPETLTRQIAIRLSEQDMARLDDLKRRIRVASRNAVAREALRIGMQLLEDDPTRLVAEPSKDSPAKRARRQ